MTAKSFTLAVQLFSRSIFWWPREGQDALPEKSNTEQKMDARKLAVDHWRYVEGVLLRPLRQRRNLPGLRSTDGVWVLSRFQAKTKRGATW